MSEKIDWKLVYTHEQEWTNLSGSWLEAPSRAVAALLYPDTTGRAGHLTDTAHFYIWPPWSNHPYGCDQWGLMDYLIEIKVLHPSQPISEVSLATLTRYGVKLGRTMQNDEWRKLWDKLMRDPDFEPKGAAEKWERKPNEPTIFK